jgi:hypothetical protein
MRTSLLSLLKVAMAASVLACAATSFAQAQAPTEPAPYVRQALSSPTLSGQGQLRFLGLRIYDARLWVGPQFDALAYGAHPLALELTYHRAFTGAAIAERSIQEIQKQLALPAEQAARWQQDLTQLLPDVQAGDRLTGLYQPGQGMALWRAGEKLGTLRDPELAQRFFGIWLSPRTSEPRLRDALLLRNAGPSP